MNRKILIIALLLILILFFFSANLLFPQFLRTKAHDEGKWLCHYNIEKIGNSLILYSKAHNGKLPKGKDTLWVKALSKWAESNTSVFLDASSFRCSNDRSSSPTSYTLNPSLINKSLGNIPKDQRHSMPLVYEKKYPKSHKWIFYLDGHIEGSGK